MSMNEQQEKAVRAIFAEATAKHGPHFANAVDLLATSSVVAHHAQAHCAELMSDVSNLGASAIRYVLRAAGIEALHREVQAFAERIVVASNDTPEIGRPQRYNPTAH